MASSGGSAQSLKRKEENGAHARLEDSVGRAVSPSTTEAIVVESLLDAEDQDTFDIPALTRYYEGQIYLSDKVVFVAGVVNIIILAFLLGGTYAWALPWYYTVKFPLLMIIRYFDFSKTNDQLYMLDFCYFANALLLAYLWIPGLAEDGRIFTMIFVITHGPLAWAVLLFRNSLVFHSLAHVTSAYIHISPMVICYALLWYGRASIYDIKWFVCDVDTGRSVNSRTWENHTAMAPAQLHGWESCYSPIWTLAAPCLYYMAWMILYGILMAIFKPDLEKFGTTYGYMTKKGFMKKLRQRKCGWLYYGILNTLAAWLMMLPASLLMRNQFVNLAFGAFAVLVAIINGANYYIEVFSKRYAASTHARAEGEK